MATNKQTTPVLVEIHRDEKIDFYKKPFKSKSLNGIVALSQEQPIPDAKVQLMDKNWKNIINETQTDKNGYFTFSSKRGDYYIQVSKEGFHTLRVKAKIRSNKRYSDQLRLKMTLS